MVVVWMISSVRLSARTLTHNGSNVTPYRCQGSAVIITPPDTAEHLRVSARSCLAHGFTELPHWASVHLGSEQLLNKLHYILHTGFHIVWQTLLFCTWRFYFTVFLCWITKQMKRKSNEWLNKSFVRAIAANLMNSWLIYHISTVTIKLFYHWIIHRVTQSNKKY